MRPRLLGEGLGNGVVHVFVAQDVAFDEGVMIALGHEHADRYAPGALARDDPVGPVRDHAVDAVLARLRHPLGGADFVERDSAQRAVGAACEGLVHGDEPLRRIAEDDRLLRAPGVRILMLQAAARDAVAGFRSGL
jgi:hypothetical protein